MPNHCTDIAPALHSVRLQLKRMRLSTKNLVHCKTDWYLTVVWMEWFIDQRRQESFTSHAPWYKDHFLVFSFSFPYKIPLIYYWYICKDKWPICYKDHSKFKLWVVEITNFCDFHTILLYTSYLTSALDFVLDYSNTWL